VLNARDLDAMVALTRVAYAQKDINALESLEAPIRLLDSDAADVVVIHIKALY
jgi:serine protease Do